jgi:hypothetical protein
MKMVKMVQPIQPCTAMASLWFWMLTVVNMSTQGDLLRHWQANGGFERVTRTRKWRLWNTVDAAW